MALIKLKELLKNSNFTQRSLAKRIDVSETTISRYMTGTQTPSIDILTKIANELHVSLDYLVGLSPQKRLVSCENCIKKDTCKIKKEYTMMQFCSLGEEGIK